MKVSPVKIAIVMIISILATARFGFIAVFVAAAILFGASIIYFAIKRTIDLGVLLTLLAVLFSCTSYTLAASSYTHPTVNYINKYVTLQGITTSPARESAYSENFKYNLKLSSMTKQQLKIKSHETILLITPQKLKCGEEVTVAGLLTDLQPSMNENGFDSAKYYKSQNIFTKIYSEDVNVIAEPKPFSLYTLSGRLAEATDNLIYTYYRDDGAAILSAVLTGSRHHFSFDYNNALLDTGFKHLFHPAYLHIAIITCLIALLRCFTPRRICDIFTAIIFIVYAFVQSQNIGFIRCLLCAAATPLLKNLRGSSHSLTNLAYVTMFCTTISPTIIFNTSFILSAYGSILALTFVPPLAKKLKPLPYILRRAIAFTVVSLAFYTPISMYYFNGVCFYTAFASIITVPAVLILLIAAPFSLLLLTFFKTAPLFGTYVNAMLIVLHKLPFIIKGLPLSQINFPTPSPMFIITFIFGLLYLYCSIRKRSHAARFCSAIVCGLSLSLIFNVSATIGTAEFTFVNVGQGDGAVIQTPFRETVIIDGGGGNSEQSTYNAGTAIFTPYLQNKGINRIEAAVVSHYHQDHIRGVISAIEKVKTDVVFAPKPTKYYTDDMLAAAKELEDVAAAHGTEVYYISEDCEVIFRDGLTLRFYSPSPYIGILDENDTTVAVKVSYGEFSALYTGDMQHNLEQELIKRTDLNSDILKVGHHGSRRSSSEEFIKSVSPTYSVISCGENNYYGHPHAETLAILSCSHVLRTDLLGDIHFRAKKDGSFTVTSQNDKNP